MKTIRAILTGTIVWILGVGVFISSFYIPLIDNLELQSNLALAISLIPLGWLGAKNYYAKYPNTSGIRLSAIMVGTAVLLDALITVPVLIIPVGGSYGSFFGSSSFWLIALEYFLVVLLYSYFHLRSISIKSLR